MRLSQLVAIACFSLVSARAGQSGAPAPLAGVWAAKWIDVPGSAPQDYGVYHFRKTFSLPATPASFIVHVTGDNRYQLYANGDLVSWGPARGDLDHWRYETVDLAPKLRAGKNVLAAVVWNDGPSRSLAQVSSQTAFSSRLKMRGTIR